MSYFFSAAVIPLLDEGLFMMLPTFPIPSRSHPRHSNVLLDIIFPSNSRSTFLRFWCRGNHSVTDCVHRLSHILATCPAHCHFSCCILTIIFCTPVCCLTYSFVRWSLFVIPINALSMLLWVIFSLSCILLVTAQV